MAALATITDLEAVTGEEVAAGADTTRAERLLEMASAAIERWCNRTFTYVEDDEITVHVDDGVLYLPNGPIAEIASITGPTVWGVQGGPVDSTAYQEIHGHVIRRYGWWGCGDYVIVYSHGYNPIPDDVISTVCQMVADLLLGPGGPYQSETIGEAAVTYTASSGRLSVPDDLRDSLRPYRVVVSSVEMVR